ncbi:MAG: homoserine kinase [Bacteroidia bacterium]
MKNIKVFAPASVANVGCGFDVLGFALEEPGDELILKEKKSPGINIINDSQYNSIPLDPKKNCAGKSLLAFLEKLGSDQGMEIVLTKKIKPGSGIGSSAASAAATVFAANELFNKPFSENELLGFGMKGEAVASGSEHADNVAPSLLGGFVIIRSYSPLDVIKIPCPRKIFCSVVLPDIVIKTLDARNILKKEIEFKKAITQWGNVAGLIAGLTTSNYKLIGRSMEDVIVEPVRSALIPGYYEVKNAAMENGALGCNISGSGPAVFALCDNYDAAEKASIAMQNVFLKQNIKSEIYVSRINHSGALIVN